MTKSICICLLLALLVGLGTSVHYHPAPDSNLHYHQVPPPPPSESGDLLWLWILLGIFGAAIIVGIIIGAITDCFKSFDSLGSRKTGSSFRYPSRPLYSPFAPPLTSIVPPASIPCNAQHEYSVACNDSFCPVLPGSMIPQRPMIRCTAQHSSLFPCNDVGCPYNNPPPYYRA